MFKPACYIAEHKIEQRSWNRQNYENAKRKDSRCMEAQIIFCDNAKDKKMTKPQIMLHYRKVKSDINLHTYTITAGWWFVYVTYRTCDGQRQSVVGLVTAGLGTGAGSLWRLQSKGCTGSSVVTFIFGAVFIAGWRSSGCLYWWNNEQNAKWWSLSKVRRLRGRALPRRRMRLSSWCMGTKTGFESDDN